METTDVLLWMVGGITVVAVALSGILLARIYGKAPQH